MVAITSDQSEYWRSAQQWVDGQDTLDRLMQPVLDRLLDEAELCPEQRVLDIGCGTGASAIAAAKLVGPAGQVTGIDISHILLERARELCGGKPGLNNIDYVEADAQSYDFPRARFDQVISRFGVMFFDDPVAAFTNIARALKPGGSLVFITWSGLAVNPWFAIPFQAATDILGKPEASDPRAPGPMAFQEGSYVKRILTSAGWQNIEISEIELELTPKGSVAEIAAFATRLGPASRIIKDHGGSEMDVQNIEAQVARNLAPFERDGALRVPATLNLVRARR